MSEPIPIDILERIFSDAHIKDIDFSLWDQMLVLCVLADHYRDYGHGRCPLLLVRFRGVAEVRFAFNHLDKEQLPEGRHYQWLVDSSSFEDAGEAWTVHLEGSLPAAPRLELTCRTVDVEEIDHRDMDRLFPRWGRPYQSLARPGIAALLSRTRPP